MTDLFKNSKLYKIGDLAEQLSIEYFRNIRNINIIARNNNYKYDFITEGLIKYEVKYNGSFILYNSFFFEYYCFDKPSGIATTEAKYYIFCTPYDNQIILYLFNVNKIKIFINNLTEKEKNKYIVISSTKNNKDQKTHYKSYSYVFKYDVIKHLIYKQFIINDNLNDNIYNLFNQIKLYKK